MQSKTLFLARFMGDFAIAEAGWMILRRDEALGLIHALLQDRVLGFSWGVFTIAAGLAAPAALLWCGIPMLGIAWAFAYLFAAVQVIWPGSFGDHRQWFDLLFLSFTTLTSVGLSDIIPVLPNARSVVMVEAIGGVFYVALVVARLVGLAAARARRG